MSRSTKKGPFVEERLMTRIETMNNSGTKRVIRTWSLTAPHGPAGSLDVSVSVTPPAATSVAVGVYVAFNAETLGLKTPPAPPLHVAPVAAPPMLPASWALVPPMTTPLRPPSSAITETDMSWPAHERIDVPVLNAITRADGSVCFTEYPSAIAV